MLASPSLADDAPKPRVGHLPHLEFNIDTHQVRVECTALDTSAPLEFFCCKTGTNEYEAMLRSDVKPSDLHTALLAIGLKPGAPVTYSEALKKLLPPHGPPLSISLEFEKDGKTIRGQALHFMRDIKTKEAPKGFGWVFAGSRIMADGKYAADSTGYLVSVVNFDLTVIDVSIVASSANETLEWERNPDVAPKGGAKVWMIIEPTGNAVSGQPEPASPAPAQTQPASGTANTPTSATPSNLVPSSPVGAAPSAAAPPAASDAASTHPALSDVHLDQQKVDRLQKYWNDKVLPHAQALRESAEAHYRVINDLRTEQQRLIDEADRIQRKIDELEKQYQEMTTPRPETNSP